MRKAIKATAELGGVLLVLTGLVICMCETPEPGQQVENMLTGIAAIAAGAGIIYTANRERDVYGSL